jgi:hypothetical protein
MLATKERGISMSESRCARSERGSMAEDRLPSPKVDFEVIGSILEQETIAVGKSIREIARIRKVYGPGEWRKRKGVARLRFVDGTIRTAEIHWYEAHGIGRKEHKIKRILR